MDAYRPPAINGSVKEWLNALAKRRQVYKGWHRDMHEFGIVSLLRAEFKMTANDDETVEPILRELEERERVLASRIFYMMEKR